MHNRSEDLSTELIDRAIVAFNGGDQATAAELSKEALRLDPDNPEAKDLVQVPAFTAAAHRSTVVYPIFTASWNSPASEFSSSERMRHDLEIHAHFEAYQKLEESARAHWGWPHFDRQRGSRWIEFRSDETASEDIFLALEFADEFLSRTINKLSDQTAWMYGCTFTVSIGISRGIVFYGPSRNVLERIGVLDISELVVAGYDAAGYVVNEAAELAKQADVNSLAISDVVTRHLNHLDSIYDQLSTDTWSKLGEPPWDYDQANSVIDELQQQLDAFPLNSKEYIRTACALAGSYIARYLKNGDELLLTLADDLLSQSLKNAAFASISGKVRATIAINSAQLAVVRYQTGQADASALTLWLGALERIYDGIRESKTPFTSSDMAPILWSLGTLNLLLYKGLGDPSHLDKAVDYLTQVRRLGVPDDNTSSLSNLASALVMRYEQLGHQEDLDAAISYYAEALPMTGASDPQRAELLSNFATALRLRGRRPDIELAVELLCEALDAAGSNKLTRPAIEANIRLTAALAASGAKHGAA